MSRKLLNDLLSAHDYVVTEAPGGREALALIRNEPPDLVLLDVLMPDMDGYEVCTAIRDDASGKALPIVMVTALDATEERVKGLEAGADDFLSKPINRPELLARVKSLLRIKSLHDVVQSQADELATLNSGLTRRVQEQLEQLVREAVSEREVGALVEGLAPHVLVAGPAGVGDQDAPVSACTEILFAPTAPPR